MDTDQFIPTRRTLLSRLRGWDDQDSWRDFFNTYWRLIYDFAIKAGLNDAQAQDAVQETVISVAREMPGFVYNPQIGSFKSWLLQITRRRVADQMRKQYRAGEVGAVRADDTAVAGMLQEIPDMTALPLDAMWDTEWRRHVAQAAMEKVKRRIRPEQFQMFELAMLKGWPAAKVAKALGCTLIQVYMARHRVGRQIRKEVEAMERKMH